MELIVHNLAVDGSIKYVQGVAYYVVPATILKSSILNGSKGTVFYPLESIEETVDRWNNIPILLNHPYKNGIEASGFDPSIFTKYGLGYIFAPKIVNQSLEVEAWFNIQNTQRISPELYRKLIAKESIEVSTGLGANLELAPEGSAFNGQSYKYVARNYKPDHLAVLLNQPGACSTKDGCGIHNSCGCNNCKGKKMEKEQLINWILNNVSVWKDREGSSDILNGFDVPSLQLIKAQAEESTTLRNSVQILTNSLNTTKTELESLKKEVQKPVLPLSREEWFKQAPADVVEVFNHSMQVQNEAKSRMIDKIVANVPEAEKPAKIEYLMNFKFEDIQQLAAMVPGGNAPAPRTAVLKYIPATTSAPVQDKVNNADAIPFVDFDWNS